MVTALKNAGYEEIANNLLNEIKYKEDFIESLNNYNKYYPYPDEQKNGFYGHTYEENIEGIYYIRHFEPLKVSE